MGYREMLQRELEKIKINNPIIPQTLELFKSIDRRDQAHVDCQEEIEHAKYMALLTLIEEVRKGMYPMDIILAFGSYIYNSGFYQGKGPDDWRSYYGDKLGDTQEVFKLFLIYQNNENAKGQTNNNNV